MPQSIVGKVYKRQGMIMDFIQPQSEILAEVGIS